jgi:CheY-like chemotaxis protein
MPDELLTLRVLLIGGADADREIWSQGASRSAVPLEFFSQGPNDQVDARGVMDICIVDAGLSETARTGVIEAARLMRPSPLIVLSGGGSAGRPSTVDGVVAHPAHADQARRLIDKCIRARLPTRVLIVDDSSTMRSIVRKILSASRFSLVLDECDQGVAALERVHAGGYGLVFLDYNMPGLNGFATLQQLRRDHPELAVVMITSSMEAALADRAHAAGALGFLRKPFYPADIDAVLERYFGLHP